MAMNTPSGRGEPYNANVEQLKRAGKAIASALIPGAEAADQAGQAYMNRNSAQNKDTVSPEGDAVSIEQSSLALETPSSFVDPSANQAQQSTQNQPASAPKLTAGVSGLEQEASALDKLGKEQASTYGKLEADYQKQDQAVANIEQQEESLAEKYAKELGAVNEEIANFKREPSSLFSGKSTWQKVVGGIGMFLGSITPEGAKNVASMINSEIDRDVKRQEANFQLLKGKADRIDNAFTKNMARFKDKKLAAIATKQNMLAAADLKLKQLEAASKGDLARAKATQGREAIGREMQKLNMEFELKAKELGMKQGKGAIPGFDGSNSNPAIIKDLTDRVAAKGAAEKQISRLEELMKEGSKNPLGANSSVAQATRQALAADLAKAMFGRSSDSELEVALSLIPDITSLTRRDGTAQKMMDALKSKLNSDVDSFASAAGFRRKLPTGARKQ